MMHKCLTMLSIEVALRERTEDAHGNSSDDQRTTESLEEYRVLDLAKSRFLDPYFAIENFPDEVTLLVLGDPGFIFVAVSAAHGIK